MIYTIDRTNSMALPPCLSSYNDDRAVQIEDDDLEIVLSPSLPSSASLVIDLDLHIDDGIEDLRSL